MPIASQIAHAAGGFRMNGGLLEKCIEGLTADEWRQRPGDCANSMLWVTGHIVWARHRALLYMGREWSLPWLTAFARGSNAADEARYPSAQELTAGWYEGKAALTAALDEISADALSAPGPEKLPSYDGMLSGAIGFMAWHETYHVGQAAYLRRLLGHGQVAG